MATALAGSKSLGKRSAPLIVAAVLLVATAVILSYRSAIDVQNATDRVAHTHAVLQQSQRVLTLVTDAETGQRGYLLTGNANYLSPYERAVAALPAALQQLRGLMEVPAQRGRVQTIESAIDRKLAELRATIELRRTQGFEPALRVVQTDAGRALMTDIRRQLAALTEEETRALGQQQAALSHKARLTSTMTTASLLFAVVATLGATALLLAGARERERARVSRAFEAARHEEASRMAAIVENSDDTIVGMDLDGVIKSWNPAAEQMFGYRADDVIGRSITIIVPSDRLEEENEVLRRLRLGEQIDHFETVRRTKDGRLLDISLTVSPLRDAAGQIIGSSKIARDITEQKRARKELEELTATLEQRVAERTRELAEINAELDAFGYTVSHDLRAPLRAMDGFAKALLSSYGEKLDRRGQEFAQRIVAAAQRMDRLIQDLLTYSRVARGEIRLGVVSLDAVVKEATQLLETDIRQRQASINVESLGRVIANRDTLLQIVSNLLSNAVKFVAPGTTPRVRIWSEPRRAMERLWIEDNGIGIPTEYHANIFRVFERLHGSETFPGTGIGLAIVRRAAERMGGHVGVESIPGEGSRFWVELPGAEPRHGS